MRCGAPRWCRACRVRRSAGPEGPAGGEHPPDLIHALPNGGPTDSAGRRSAFPLHSILPGSVLAISVATSRISLLRAAPLHGRGRSAGTGRTSGSPPPPARAIRAATTTTGYFSWPTARCEARGSSPVSPTMTSTTAFTSTAGGDGQASGSPPPASPPAVTNRRERDCSRRVPGLREPAHFIRGNSARVPLYRRTGLAADVPRPVGDGGTYVRSRFVLLARSVAPRRTGRPCAARRPATSWPGLADPF